ncbi:transporter [Ganoderma sinense ZZ0214-1]|uniref:Transporter n=1 Tax=Ganoderma sinense ZZ0214-1 TaxID=1077348 RepID=A0A2G8SCD4_9APHY|nr:transporter [Ganoderma sinense ZZ0214-1]
MSPISTAHLNPYAETFCLPTPGSHVLIPLLLNNTNPASVRYTLTPLVPSEKSRSPGRVEHHDLSAKDLRAIEQGRAEHLQLVRAAAKQDSDEYDEYDDDEDDDGHGYGHNHLQKTQHLTYIRLSKPGTLNLDRILDQSGVDARLVVPNEVTIVPCPRAEFSPESHAAVKDVRCAPPGLVGGSGEELQFDIDIFGVPPLSLRWHREVGAKREAFMVEGIEGADEHHAREEDDRRVNVVGQRAPTQVRVPLTVVLDAIGTHTYTLESVTDSLGNVVHAGQHTDLSRKTGRDHTLATSRSVTVLRRPSVSFKHCGPGQPASLLIGSEAPLTVATVQADLADAPWDVDVRYDPPYSEDGAKPSKRYKGWTKTLKTQAERRDLTLRASAPGEYTIVGVKGQHCEGDVLSPETCRVIERPLPTAEIEWKKIHECSGDIGVSASLVLHGTPPFQVYYRSQRDSENPKEHHKTFPTSRGELTVQPDRSGHYTFKIYQVSDANYKKIELKAAAIELDVHPPPSADFVGNSHGGRGKKSISSCSGSNVDVEVELRGTAPWNIEVQIVGPKGSEIVPFRNIETAKKTLSLPIPQAIDRDGGSFEVELVSVEDAYKCKRSLSVPGIAVNVRRILPTVKFYGKADQRRVTILDHEQARLPLRLTGEGPWRVQYRRLGGAVEKVALKSLNDELLVNAQGTYELVGVTDSRCPGTVVGGESTYRVEHVPRPAAKLSPDIISTYERYNGSHILPAICEGSNDNVDLDLTGRSPFQIMYNIAKDDGLGGTKLLDQPTFSSIQPRTRFQLRTSEPARIYYEVKQIGDVSYPLEKNKDAIIPRSERLLFEQQVLMRPSARFKNHNRLSYCFSDAFTSQDQSYSDGLVILEGTPPFYLQVSVRNLAASETHLETIELWDTQWRVHLPEYTFRSIGPHQVTIESVRDASHCEQVVPDPLFRSVWVDVAETAAIIPFSRREDYCVGDAIPFQLEGTPPWTIGFRVNGRAHTQEAKLSPWAAQQQAAGEFAITSVAHQQRMCKTAVTDLRYAVHPLPSAQVGHGKRIVQDIHEGDQAEIVFTLIGEPPFTFTYQRAELSPRKGAQGKVLETHTVSGVTTKEYSIFSALEGTWTITSISDRYCRYPPAQQDGGDKSR